VRIFSSHANHEDLLLGRPPKRLDVILHTLGANFSKSNNVGTIFVRIFRLSAHIFRYFANIFIDFAQTFTEFARIFRVFARIFDKSNLLAVRFQPLHPRLLHYCFRGIIKQILQICL